MTLTNDQYKTSLNANFGKIKCIWKKYVLTIIKKTLELTYMLIALAIRMGN